MTDPSGNVVENLAYQPYGATQAKTGSVDVHHKYTGQELDNATGLYFYGARYYDPVLGRFISADTMIQTIRNPQSLNRYSYAANNPMRYIDPTGNEYEDIWGSGDYSWLYSGDYISNYVEYPSYSFDNYVETPSYSSYNYGYDFSSSNFTSGSSYSSGYTALNDAQLGQTNIYNSTASQVSDLQLGDIQALGSRVVAPCKDCKLSNSDLDFVFAPLPMGMAGAAVEGGLAGFIDWAAGKLGLVGTSGPVLARELGIAGEEAAGIIKNTERIGSITGTANYRVPDILNHELGIIGEVKNVQQLSLTTQLQDYILYAQENGGLALIKWTPS